MIKRYMEGLLFFEGGRELRVVAYDVSRTSAVMHSDGLGLLPIHFYITFDGFLTVGKCRLAWRYRDDVGVVFERWLDIPQCKTAATVLLQLLERASCSRPIRREAISALGR